MTMTMMMVMMMSVSMSMAAAATVAHMKRTPSIDDVEAGKASQRIVASTSTDVVRADVDVGNVDNHGAFVFVGGLAGFMVGGRGVAVAGGYHVALAGGA